MKPRKTAVCTGPAPICTCCFNEAGAMKPRKTLSGLISEVRSLRFNEAGAMKPRKTRASQPLPSIKLPLQ